MGLIEQEIKEIREMAKNAMAGTMTASQASVQIGFLNQTAKRVGQIIQIAAFEIKGREGQKAYNNIVKANVIGAGTAIEIGTVGDELIVCRERGGKCVTREECLDYSGSEQNIDTCQNCEHFDQTRKYCFA